MVQKLLLGLLLTALALPAVAQQEDEGGEPAPDMSGVYVPTEEADVKEYCTQKVLGLSPSRLVGVGYDLVGGFGFTTTASDTTGLDTLPVNSRFALNHGLRVEFNAPVISNTKNILQLGVSYWESRYRPDSVTGNAIASTLAGHPLRNITASALLFKPLNATSFLLFQAQASLAGNYNFGDSGPDFGKTKIQAAAIWGKKPTQRKMWGVGLSRTYLGGELLLVPVVLYNHTFESDKWGIEALLPARAQVRRTFSARSMGFFGYDLEGMSYNMQHVRHNVPAGATPSDMVGNVSEELRKSEIRLRFEWQRSLSGFVWFRAQAGYRLVYKYGISPFEQGGLISTPDFTFSNEVGAAPYFNFSINLVSP